MNRSAHFTRALALLAAGLLLTSTLLVAQPYPPPWRDISAGIRLSAVIHALAVSADGRTLYAAAYEPGGLAQSTDGGHTWQRVDIGRRIPLSVAVAPDDARCAYVGLVDGALHSGDGGRTWTEVPALAGLSVNAWLFAPDGALYAGTSAGLRISTDSGKTWASPAGAPDSAVLCLLLDPVDRQTLYVGTDIAGLYIRDRAGWRGGGQGHVNGMVGDPATGRVYIVALHRLFYTTDTGHTWQEIPGPPLSSSLLSLGLTSTASGPILYAGVDEGQGLYRSSDEGVTWQRLDSPASAGSLCGSTVLSLLALDEGRILAGTNGAGLFVSPDDGTTWQPAGVPLGTPRLAAILPHPTQPGLLFAGASDGVYRSTDAGASWRRVTGALGRLDVLVLAVQPRDPRTIYAGAYTGVYRSMDSGDTWHPWMTGIPDVTVYSFTFDPADPLTIYAGTRGNNVCRTMDGGATWAPIHHGLETLSAFCVHVDARDPRLLIIGTVEGVYRSTDRGESWVKLEGPLAGLTVFCLLETEGRLYAGATDGVYVSLDRGSTWMAQSEGLGARTVVCLARDPARPAVLYAGTEGAGVYRSTDGGVSWQSWARGLEEASVYALALDPFDRTRLYAATDRGAFVLAAWTP